MKKGKQVSRARRKIGIRKVVVGSATRPRLCVFRSAKHIYVQVINDAEKQVLAALSSLSPELRKEFQRVKKRDQAKQVGLRIARLCLDKGVQAVVFDRNGFRYHGRIRAIADGAREAGLRF